MPDAKITRRQVPVEVDVKILRERFPRSELFIGRIITYEEIEPVLKCTRRSYRFQTVIGVWRHALLVESNIALMTMVNVGYKVADDHQKISIGDNYRTQSMRRLKRSAEHYNAVNCNNLTEDERKLLASNVRSNSSILTALAMTRELPRPEI